ncbi:hypothetical protein RBSH_03500 [Rhodopirellula baltica SH28]|uniref:Uncharacterized protein n=1 Tax=Rhodopirellula baltica SH28 TaxID=993517 RepID=K5CCM3_RHOBT|nr:hypothetical protein RBSH_03500 [Rhodopirellula baltica SH28]
MKQRQRQLGSIALNPASLNAGFALSMERTPKPHLRNGFRSARIACRA